MATGKMYYWIKLKTDFMTSDKVDFLMSQQNGAEYVVLYQMLCLKCINTNGVMARRIGEMLIPFDIPKIERDCKYFSQDTIRVALEMFKKLGMIYKQEDGFLCIEDFGNMVGKESDYAIQKRNQRKSSGQLVDKGVDNVHTDIRDRDKRLDIRDKILDIEKEKEVNNINNTSYYLSDKSDDVMTFSTPKDNTKSDIADVVKYWNECCLSTNVKPVKKITNGTNRYEMLNKRIKDYGVDEIKIAIDNIFESNFLQGKVNEFIVTFDWFIKPNNFVKVYEGNYSNSCHKPKGTGTIDWDSL